MDCALCRIRVRTEWYDLSAADVACLNAAKVRRHYAAGEQLFEVGEGCSGLYYVAAGLIGYLRRFVGSATGGLMTFRHPGDVLALRSFLSGGTHLATAKAVQPSTVCFLPSETVRALMGRNPKTMLRFLRRIAGSLECAEETLADNGLQGVRRRIVRLLAMLRLAYTEPGASDSGVIELPLTRDEVVAAVGASPRCLATVLQRLAEEGVAVADEGAVRILDSRRLQDAIRNELPAAGQGHRR